MYWHIILTEVCNSQCRYCYEKSMKEFDNGLQEKWDFDLNVPCDSEIDFEKLKKFILKDENPVIIFYGGEPLLKINKIKEIMDLFKDKVRYCMQTNGKLLDKLDEEYMNRFSRILVSIDGDKQRTDYNRGKGNYDKVLENIKLIRKNGYKGEIVARMTIAQEFPDLLEQLRHLLEIREFDSVHWQLDMGFYKNDFEFERISNFVEEYNKSVKKLIDYWFEEMHKGRVLKLYPFLGIFESLYYDKKTKLRCGAGHSGFAITTKGEIAACPIMNNIKNFYCGDLDSNPKNLKCVEVGEPCNSCEVKDICGGRCLYSNKAKLWPREGEDLICKTVKFLIFSLKQKIKEIRKLIEKGVISEEDFQYEKYFGPEIIP